MNSFAQEFISTAVRRFKYYKYLGEQTFAQLSEEDMHYSPNEESNSVAIIIQHMSGNMLSRWTNFLEEDGEKEWRKRDEEFEKLNYTKEELLQLWEKGWACMFNAIEPLTEKELLLNVTIRNEPLTVIDAINRQLAHYPYHVGQIIYVAKIIKDNNWKNLSIPKGTSAQYNSSSEVKDPAKKF